MENYPILDQDVGAGPAGQKMFHQEGEYEAEAVERRNSTWECRGHWKKFYYDYNPIGCDLDVIWNDSEYLW